MLVQIIEVNGKKLGQMQMLYSFTCNLKSNRVLFILVEDIIIIRKILIPKNNK